MTEGPETSLGRAVRAAVQGYPERNGVYALRIPREAFATRALLARAAERTPDLQSYIWRGDPTGFLRPGELWVAGLFGGVGVEDATNGAPLGSVTRDDGRPFLQDEIRATVFIGDTLVTVGSRGITYYSIRPHTTLEGP